MSADSHSQELDRLGDLVDRQRRRIGLQLGDDVVDALDHRPPVLHREPHLGEHGSRPRTRSARAAASSIAIDMDVDEAFALAAGGIGRAERRELAPCRVTPRTGCATSRTASSRSVSSPITESTRNGMSSLTISITEIDRCEAVERQRLAGDLRAVCRPLGQERPRRARRAWRDRPRRSAPGPPAPRAPNISATKVAGTSLRRSPSSAAACAIALRAAASSSLPGSSTAMVLSRVSGIMRGGESAAGS